MSFRAAGERTTRRGPPDSSTSAFSRAPGSDLLSKLVDVAFEFVYRAKFQAFAPADLVESFPHGAAQPFQFGALLLFVEFHEPKPLAYDLTGVAVTAGDHLDLDEPVEVVGQIDVSRRHGPSVSC